MIVTTGNDVAGHVIAEYLGVARGIVVHSPTISTGFLGGTRIDGGSFEEFPKVCYGLMEKALQDMVKSAEKAGADAVIGVRYDTPTFAAGNWTGIIAYGTAVKLRPA
jgi:uncharacterized protein YbjQ (UPF0145 family)